MDNTIHYFWTLCPDGIKDGDTFSMDIEHVNCSHCLIQVIPFTDFSPVTPAEDEDRMREGGL